MKKKSLATKILLALSVILVLTVTGFVINSDTNGSNDLTKNTKLKNDVFGQIINNRELFTDFMNDMMQHPQSMQWMMNNQGMMQYMFSDNHLGYMMHNNSYMRQMMMQNMMNTIQSDSTFTYQWDQMMNNHYGMHHGMMMQNQ